MIEIEDELMNMSKEDLVSTVRDLMMECDDRHSHEDALEKQVRSLGYEPISYMSVSPFSGAEEFDAVEYCQQYA